MRNKLDDSKRSIYLVLQFIDTCSLVNLMLYKSDEDYYSPQTSISFLIQCIHSVKFNI